MININLLIKFLVHSREVTRMHLPIGHSFIPYEMILIVVLHFLNEEELTVKRLFNSGSFSEMGNLYHFRKLLKDEWLSLEDHPSDSRLKLILPSPKLLSSFEVISKELHESFLDTSKQYLGLNASDDNAPLKKG